jgi:peptide/nickel transport system substrate-binding protein
MIKKLLLIPLAIVLLSGGLFNVYGETGTQDKYGGIIRSAIQQGVVQPGYPPESNPQSLDAAYPACDPFVRVWPDHVEPLLATDYKISADSITFSLRKGVKFQDGTDFNAAAAKWNIDKNVESKRIRGIASVDVLDDYTVRVNTPKYNNMLFEILGFTPIISPSAVEKNGLEWARLHPVGAGPFTFVKYDRDSKLVYKRNPNYWDKGKPYTDGVEFVVIKDDTVRKIAFENGEITFIRAIGMTAQELKDKGYPSVSKSYGSYALFPDSKHPQSPLAHRKVRLAISHAINREAVAQALGYGFVKPAYQLYPGWDPIPGLKKQQYDPELAKQLLAEAGYPNGFKTVIYGFPKVIPREYIEAVAGMLRKVGIDVTTQYPEAGAYQKMRFEGWEGMLCQAMFGTQNLNRPMQMYFDGKQFPDLKRPDGFHELMNASYATPEYSPAKLQAVLQLLNDDQTVIPLLEEVAIDFYHKGAHDLHLLEFSAEQWEFEDAWLDPDLR